MQLRLLTLTAVLLTSTSVIAGDGFGSFSSETDRATKALACPRPKTTPASAGLGALYGCVVGRAETVKFFINEGAKAGQVKNVKLMWNDWFKDTGYGVHADQPEAEKFVRALAALYAPSLKDKLLKAFFANENTTVEAGQYRFAYSYSRGPAIDERLIVVTQK